MADAEGGTVNEPAQLPLCFDPPSNGTDTSSAAASSIKEHRARLLSDVYCFVGKAPTTCDAAEIALGMSHQTCSARFNDLQRLGLIYATDERRATRSGRSARVYATGTKPTTKDNE